LSGPPREGKIKCVVNVRRAEELQKEKEKYKVVNNELDATFAELTGF